MAKAVKRAKRPYDSTKRQQQAAATRSAVLSAARTLFLRHGYAGATMQAIADEAGVAVQTVYAAFGTKRGLLRQLLESSIVGDDDPAPLYEQTAVKEVRTEPDPRATGEAIGRDLVRDRRAGRRRLSDPQGRGGLGSRDGGGRSTGRRRSARRDAGVRRRCVKGPGKLRDPIDRTAATLFILHSPDIVIQCLDFLGWSMDDYEEWLAEMLLRTTILE